MGVLELKGGYAMILVLYLKNGSQICEQIRTAEVGQGKLVYYRQSFYAGERHEIDVEDINMASIMTHGKEICLKLN